MLDEKQLEIVNSTAKKIIVDAGAGSGKTRVLIERIRKLLNDGIEAQNIVAITFTNMAAEEMKERISSIPGSGDCFIGTIHSFANQIFKTSNQDYKLYSEEIENQFMSVLISLYAKELTMERYLKYKETEKEVKIGKYSNNIYEELFTKGELYEIFCFRREKNDINGYPETIWTLCKKHNIITFDELIKRTAEYFQSINGKVEYLFVDEYQDIGPLEDNFFKSLNAENYFLIGDDFQAIYGFKGGDVNLFLDLMNSEEWTTYYLENNYRSGRKILEMADVVIRQADNIIDKQFVACSGLVGNVTIDTKYKIDKYLESINNFKDWFVLVRTNKDLFALETKMNELNIPYTSFRKGEMSLDEMRKCMDEDKIKLLTVHTSKGLESENVLLYGNFFMRERSYMKNPEERKVMYVGMTRAKQNLIILN